MVAKLSYQFILTALISVISCVTTTQKTSRLFTIQELSMLLWYRIFFCILDNVFEEQNNKVLLRLASQSSLQCMLEFKPSEVSLKLYHMLT